MEEAIKNRVILILAVVSAIFFLVSVSSCLNLQSQKANLDKQKAAGWDLEQKTAKLIQEKAAAETKLKDLASQFEEEKTARQADKKALVQEQMVNASLKEELQKITKLKEALEEDLKEALVAGKAAKPK